MQDLQIRSWDSFVDVKSFAPPANAQEAKDRVVHNLQYYRANYAFVAIGIITLGLYFAPTLFWVLAVPGAVGGGLFLTPKLEVSGHRFTSQEKGAIQALVLIFFIWWTQTAWTIYTVAFLLAAVILSHAVLRKKSIKSTVSNFVDTSGVKGVRDDAKKTANMFKRDIKKALD
eukprot:TRINITY_DN230_c0_g1_i1.p1 TRINITY_DN230_c0_g1~~TRINITY_DN230_c0_g1_i1.p1  ORF type:complete len:185 (-),score=45.66 TRINITY_DN230_c0_g1_i1:82-597(-)